MQAGVRGVAGCESRWAVALAMSVLPVPGGPKSSRPLGGRREPVKMSGRMSGHTVISRTDCLAKASPAMASKGTPGWG